MSPQEDKAELLKYLDKTRAKTNAVLDVLNPDQVFDAGKGWRVRDVIAILTAWQLEGVTCLQALSKGETYKIADWDGLDSYHHQAIKNRESLPIAQLFGDFEAAHIRFKSLVRKFPDDKLDRKFVFPWGAIGTLETLVTALGHHEESHCFDLIESTRSD
jgi:hypothetical protein